MSEYSEDTLNAIKSGIDKLNKTAGVAATGIATLAKGTADAQTVLNFGSGAAGLIPGLGGLSDIFNKLGTTTLEMAKDLQAGSKQGVYFQQSLGLFASTVLGARDSMESWQARLEKSATSFNQLGLGMDKSMIAFGTMAKQLQEQPLAASLESTGIKAEELNDVLALSISTRKFVDYSDDRAKKSAIDSALLLSREMDNLARLTGLSRQEQQKQLEEQMSKPDVAALIMSMSEEQAESFLATSQKLGAQAENVRDLFAEMATGDVRSKAGTEKMAALNYLDPRLARMLEESAKLSQSSNIEDQRRAAQLAEQFGPALQASLTPDKLKEIARLARSGVPEFEQLNKIITETKDLGANFALRQKAFSEGITVEEARRREEQRIDKQREGLTETGELDPEAAAYRAAKQADRLAKDITAGAAIGFDELNKKVGEQIVANTELIAALRARTAEEIAASPKEIFEKLRSKFLGEAEPEVAPPELPQTTGIPAITPPPIPEGANLGQWYVGGKPVEPPGRASGTTGATGGKLIEDWGTESLIKVHGKEGIITDEQISEMYKNTQSAIGAVASRGTEKVAPAPTFMPGELSISQTSIKSLIDGIKGPTEDLGTRLEKLSEKDIDRMVADKTARAELVDQIYGLYAGKPMTVDPIIDKVASKLDTISTASKPTDREDAIISYIKSAEKPVQTTPPPIKISIPKSNIDDRIAKQAEDFFSGKTKGTEQITSKDPRFEDLHKSILEGGLRASVESKQAVQLTAENLKLLSTTGKANLPNEKLVDAIKANAISKSAETVKPPSVAKISEPTGFFDRIEKVFYQIGNIAGKQYDEIGKKFTSTLDNTTKAIKLPVPEPATKSSVDLSRIVNDMVVNAKSQTDALAGSITTSANQTAKNLGMSVADAIKSNTSTTTESIGKSLSSLGVTPIKSSAPTTESLGKTLSSLGVTPIATPSNYVTNETFSKFATSQENVLKKTVPTTQVERTVIKEPTTTPKPTELKMPVVEKKDVSTAPKTITTPVTNPVNLSSVKDLFDKSKELSATGDEKRAKIYEDTAKRQIDTYMKSFTVPEKISTLKPVSTLGAGSDMAAIKAMRANDLTVPRPIKTKVPDIKINETENKKPADEVKQAQGAVVTKAVKEKSEIPKTDDFEKIITRPLTPAPLPKKEPEIPAAAKPDIMVMNDIKTELVMLNKSMRELISHTHEVADTARKQVRVTKQAATNNALS